MQLSQYNLCTRKTELVLRDETNYLSRLSPSLREFIARARSAEQRGDVKYVSTAVLVNSVDLAHVFSWVFCDQSRGLFLCWPAESLLLPLNHLFSVVVVVVVVVVFFFQASSRRPIVAIILRITQRLCYSFQSVTEQCLRRVGHSDIRSNLCNPDIHQVAHVQARVGQSANGWVPPAVKWLLVFKMPANWKKRFAGYSEYEAFQFDFFEKHYLNQ